jgi:hypothetical protein
MPSRSSVHAELRDGDSSVVAENVILFSLVYQRDMALSFLYDSKRKEESKGLPAGYSGDEHIKSLTPS